MANAPAHLEYVVERVPETWTIKFGGAHCGTFAERRQALRAALTEAPRLHDLGLDLCIRVVRPDGTTKTIWQDNRLHGHLALPTHRQRHAD